MNLSGAAEIAAIVSAIVAVLTYRLHVKNPNSGKVPGSPGNTSWLDTKVSPELLQAIVAIVIGILLGFVRTSSSLYAITYLGWSSRLPEVKLIGMEFGGGYLMKYFTIWLVLPLALWLASAWQAKLFRKSDNSAIFWLMFLGLVGYGLILDSSWQNYWRLEIMSLP